MIAIIIGRVTGVIVDCVFDGLKVTLLTVHFFRLLSNVVVSQLYRGATEILCGELSLFKVHMSVTCAQHTSVIGNSKVLCA